MTKLSDPQRKLLTELVEAKDGLYIRRSSRYYRTVHALVKRDLVRCAWMDHSPMSQDQYVPTEAGRALVESFDG